jgi:hypothetical protein
LPATACHSVMGSVMSNSMLPLLRSSAQRRIEMAGISTRYSHGCQRKKGCRSAWPRSKKPPTWKVNTPASTRKITMNTYASGVAK